MTTARGTDGWTGAVRQRLALGRLLPLGGAADGAWLAERAAAAELRRAAATVPGGSLTALRISLAGPDSEESPAVPPPPGALPPGPLRIDADLTAVPGEPLPALAERLRGALFGCAADRLGLRVTEIDLRVTDLLDPAAEPAAPAASAGVTEGTGAEAAAPEDARALAVAAVPGVAHLTGILGSMVTDGSGGVRVELATAAGHRPLVVARAVRDRLATSRPSTPVVTVLVTAVEVTESGWPARTV
jgi:hypothetical protein